MQIEMSSIVTYLGELVAAAQHDLKAANPGDVGLHGVSIVAWREAYLEGIKDSVEGFLTRVPDAEREAIKAAILDAHKAEAARLAVENPNQ